MQILQSLLLAAGIYGLASLLLPSPGGIAARGVFASKNSMGLSMVLLWAVSLCVLFDPLQPKWLRIASAVRAAVAFKLVFQAQSATAVLLAFGVAALMVFGLLVRGRGLFHPLVLMVFFGFFSMISLALALVLAVHDVDLVGMVLDKFGKDATLTGRTVLWGYAFEQIREHPGHAREMTALTAAGAGPALFPAAGRAAASQGLEHGAEQAPAYPLLSGAIRLGCRAAIALSKRI